MPLLPSSTDAAAPHLSWDGREFKRGEATFFEIAGCYRRYHTPFCRTVFLGKPPQYLVEAEKALVEGLEAGFETARPGNRACDVANALHDSLRKVGIKRSAHCGYRLVSPIRRTGASAPPPSARRTRPCWKPA